MGEHKKNLKKTKPKIRKHSFPYKTVSTKKYPKGRIKTVTQERYEKKPENQQNSSL